MLDSLELFEIDSIVSVILRYVAYQGIDFHTLLKAHRLEL